MDDASQQLITVARSVLEQLDLEIVLKRVLDAAQQLTGAEYAALGVLDESRSELARFITRGIDEPTRRRIGPLPTGRGVLGELIRNPTPLRIDDVGSHPYSYGFPVGHPTMRTFLGVPIVIDDAPWGNLYLTEKRDGRPFDEDDEQAAMLLAQFASLAIDHARRYAHAEQQRGGLQRTVDALEATIQITRALGGETDLAAILELVAKRGRALVSARALVIELLDGDQLHFATGAGELPVALRGRRVPLHDTVGSVALRERTTQRLSDPGNRARFEQHGLGQLGIDSRDGLVVPLMFRERGYGVLVALDSRDTDQFTADHQRLLEAFAASAAIAVATARSAADERQRQRLAAADAERARWARELHDETLQALGNLRLVLAAASRKPDAGAKDDAIQRALAQLEDDIANLRGLITELRPAALDQLGLDPALLALADRVRASGLEIDTNIELACEAGNAPQRLTPELENAVYRIVQESLTNAIKHGCARRAVVEVDDSSSQLRITVRDDGGGFDPDVATNGFGLVGMRERTELLGGDLQVASSPGAGTTVTVSLPVARRDDGERAASAASGRQPVQ